ncbi:Nif3-like dinuclear metal center hexameric protein [soil metagenome]
MKIQDITSLLEKLAAPSLQEPYDNSGLLTGNDSCECTGIVVSLDVTEDIVNEAIEKKANLIVAHHPIIFKGLKKITGKNYVEQTIIKAIKNDIAIYAIHTNLDNVIHGVNGKIADMIGLVNRQVLLPKENLLQKLAVFVPSDHKQKLLEALFAAGAGNIGNYNECSFTIAGTGSFKAGENTNPFVGVVGERHYEAETRIEVIFPAWLQRQVLDAMKYAHPYEEIAFDIYRLNNPYGHTGGGLLGELENEVDETIFLEQLKKTFKLSIIRHTAFRGKPVKKIALCGGAGSFLTGAAKLAGADVFISSDIKYHEFFDAEGRLLLADIGHYESEQFTIDLLFDILREKFPNFAVLKTGVNTNPVKYFQ